MISIARHVVGMCIVLTVHVCRMCSLHVDTIKIFKKISGCGLYTGALNSPEITVMCPVGSGAKCSGGVCTP